MVLDPNQEKIPLRDRTNRFEDIMAGHLKLAFIKLFHGTNGNLNELSVL